VSRSIEKVAEVLPLCAECGTFRRAPALRVCSACWDVAQEQMMRSLNERLRDPEQAPPRCMECGEVETPDDEVQPRVARGEQIVSMAALARRDGTDEYAWLCSGCVFNDDDGEDWKR